MFSRGLTRDRSGVAALVLCSIAWLSAPARADFELVSDQNSTVTGATLCLAVDPGKPLTAPAADKSAPASSQRFYPVVSARCDALAPAFLSKWRIGSDRDLRIFLNGKAMCLTARYMTNFTPLLDPFLDAFKANEPGSSFSYLRNDLKPNGQINAVRLRANPDLVAGPCGLPEGADFWVYDDINGTISGPGGWDDKSPRRRQCVTMHGDWNFRPPKHDAGMPVSAADCPDVVSYKRNAPAHQRWSASNKEGLPTYVEPSVKDYFNGAGGLPVVGPLGRCLTADVVLRTVVTSDCDGRLEQAWKVEGGTIRLGPGGPCLTNADKGAVELAACANDASQQWVYVVPDPTPNPRWLNEHFYGQIHPKNALADCLITAADPFLAPPRQHNQLKVAACAAVMPRQTNWFQATRILTVRLGLLRLANDDDTKPALGNRTDDALMRVMESMAFHLSEQYRGLGVRFVFDPKHDFLHVRDTKANQGIPETEGAQIISRIVSNSLYGRLSFVIADAMNGGGFSGWDVAEYELSRTGHWVSPSPPKTRSPWPVDKAGVPAVGYYVAESKLDPGASEVGHHAHEIGHFLGLPHTFGPDEFPDTPEDTIDGAVWSKQGAVTCGNPRSGSDKGRTVTPDRTNNQSYWGCMLGRTMNSFTPMQLGKTTWVLNNQLNRYPIVACQPTANYDANAVECENAESLERCEQTAAYLKSRSAEAPNCQRGGKYSRAIAAALRQPAVLYLLQNTPNGRSLISRLAGGEARDEQGRERNVRSVIEALKDNKNLAVTMALVHRINEFQLAATRYPSLGTNGFVVDGTALLPVDQKAVTALSGQVLTPDFVTHVPKIIGP